MAQRPNNRALIARRHALTALGFAPLAAPLAQAQTGALAPTPTQTLGPFYPRSPAQRPLQIDADLLTVAGGRVLTKGTPLYLTGRVLSRTGEPLAQALVEIWQCDANAVYHHPDGGAEDERDPAFQGYGQTRTGADGTFHFRTIEPVPYPGRTPHIHVRVQAARHGTLATQLYLPNHPGNERDFLYRRMSAAERAAVALNLESTRATHPLAQATSLMASVQLVLA
ncbi:MAG TPA: intradiol ring-cleavage dioxygenase [Burkholderiaceae bacterium]|jgi:protocatechuate 3,4-dioxygenase beta subunit|nr:intradiol ring-cleavage dioxygenase [Burkholderiaceae bacterium]